jgi:mannosyltransferase
MSVPMIEKTSAPSRPWAWLANPALPMVLLALVLVLGVALRLLLIDNKSLWYDEAASLYFADRPVPDVIQLTIQRDTPPPLYYLALHAWIGLFGDSVLALRLLSAVASIACLPLLYWFARPLAGRTTALVATALFAIAPFQIWYAQEARMYALLTLTSLASCLTLARLVERPGRGRWLAHVAATGAMLWVHYIAVFVLLAQALAVLVIWLRWRRERPFQLWTWSAVVVGGATLLPWLPAFLIQSKTYSRFWMPGDRPLLVAGVFLILAGVGGWALRRKRTGWLLPLLLAVVPLVLAYAVGMVRPLFLARTLIMVTPFLTLLTAAGLVALARWRWPVAALALAWLLAWNGLALQNLYRVAPKEPWDEAARYVAERSQPGEIVIFHSAPGEWPFAYYLRQYAVPLELTGVPRDIDTSEGALEQDVDDAALERLDAVLASGRPVWLVLSHNEYIDPDHRVVEHLDARRSLADRHELYRIEVRRYVP